MIAFLIVVVVIVAVGATVLAYRNRPESSIESGISSFRREMRALAPPGQRRAARVEGDDESSSDPATDPSPTDDHRPDGPAPGAG